MRRSWIKWALLALVLTCAGCRSWFSTERSDRGGAEGAAGRAQTPAYKYTTHYVKRYETLYSIGRLYGVPWQRIQESNRCDPNNLRVGQPLLIPLHERTGPPQPPKEPAAPERAGPTPVRRTPPEALHRGKPSSPYWWPAQGTLVRRYGQVVRGFPEPGIGLRAPQGAEVCAVAAGTVISIARAGRSPRPGWGNVVCIQHSGGIASWYAHLDQIAVKEGEQVGKGQRIGLVGASGAATQPEVALRMFKNERPVDPLQFLP